VEQLSQVIREVTLEVPNRKIENMLRETFSPKRDVICSQCSLRPSYCMGSVADWHRCRYALRISGDKVVLISGSMSGNKSVYASGVALAFVRQAVSEGSVYFLRFFDDTPHDLHKITTKEEANKICSLLIRQPFSGGGTNIQKAILTAVNDISKSPEDFEKSEIMVITDGEDEVDLDPNDLKNIKIHSTVIDGGNHGLEIASTTYTELKSNDLA